ncbi:MAG TPA: Zn-ribbon domain-containing OB-fold protein [Acidimicrobiales bacterium]|nr:Zn-ribbon domain-containing OB-fold protein [Acidimicrobiales bacterium]
MPELPIPVPAPNFDTQEFWDATAEGRFLLKRCDDCGVVIWYPRFLCPDCSSTSTSWFEATGKGTVYSFTVPRRGNGAYREAAPFIVAYVELEEGPRILTNLVDVAPESVAVGLAVEVVWHDTGEGNALYRFRPV